MQQEEKMFIRPITLDDVENFYHMMCWLDEETEYMMYEPGERQLKSNNLDDLKERIEVAVLGEDFLMVAVNDNEEIVGYIWAETVFHIQHILLQEFVRHIIGRG